MSSQTARMSILTYKVQKGQGTTAGGTTSCKAINQPHSEANYAPINMLFIDEDEKREPKITVAFWPGALPEKAQSIIFTLNVGSEKKAFDVPAKLGNPEWNVISTTGPLPKDFLDVLSDPGKPLYAMNIEVPGSTAKTIFGVEDISRVLNLLNSCVYELEQSKKS